MNNFSVSINRGVQQVTKIDLKSEFILKVPRDFFRNIEQVFET